MLKDIKSEYLNLFFQMVLIVPIMACWQSGDAADCKSVNTCSIHVHASKLSVYTKKPEKNNYSGSLKDSSKAFIIG